MRDAPELALSIAGHDDITSSITAYEQKMYAYSAESAKASDDNLKLILRSSSIEAEAII